MSPDDKAELARAIQRLSEFPEHSEEYTLERHTADLQLVCSGVRQLLDENEKLTFGVNYLRLPLKIDPAVSNLDTVKLLNAMQEALDRRGPEF